MTVQNTDVFVVSRGGTLHSVTAANANGKIQDTDLLVVRRGTATYKITGQVFKAAAFQDGDLFIVNRNNTSYKATGALVKAILQKAPIIQVVTLAEDDDKGAAFTSESFTATITMQEPGMPVATHKLKAWVEGELTTQLTSTNAITATSDVSLGFTSQTWVTNGNVRSSIWDGTKFLAGGGAGDAVLATSPDGVTWTKITLPANNIYVVTTLDYGNGIYVAGGTQEVAVSTDGGVTWAIHVVDAQATELRGSFFYNGEFWLVGTRGASAQIWSSPDGVNWTRKHDTSGNFNDLATNGKGTFVAVGDGEKVATSTDGGATWTDQALAFPGGANAISGVAYGNGLFVAACSNRQEIATSTDGVTWTTATTGLPVSGQVNCCDYLGGTFYIGGSQGKLHSSVDGVTWVDKSPSFGSTKPIRSICGSPDTLLVTSDDGPFVSTSAVPSTILTIAGAKTDGFLAEDAIHSVPAAANGVIISLTDSQVVASPSTAWAVGQKIQGTPKKQAGSRLYLKFNAAGAVSDLQSADPGYVQTTNQANPKLTFPATFPSGKAPDDELPAGATITVEAQATNTSGTVTKTSNTLTPSR